MCFFSLAQVEFSLGWFFFSVIICLMLAVLNICLNMFKYFSEMGHHIVIEYVHCSTCNHCVWMIFFAKFCRSIHFKIIYVIRAHDTSSLSSSFSSISSANFFPVHLEGVSVLL